MPQVILFKDYLFYDDDNEYLKRYYKIDEIQPRVSILTDFYQNSYKETRPNLIITDCNKIISKRAEKLNKILNSKNSKNKQKDENSNVQRHNKIIGKVLTSNLSNNSSSIKTHSSNTENDTNYAP